MTDELGYASAAEKYWEAGWRGILPLPHGEKYPPPKDTTGYGGYWPSWADIHAWSTYGGSNKNLGLRLPNTVIGLDCDHYDTKRGGDTLAHAETLWGPLPHTIRSTSRLDGISGIRLYRVPAGTELDTILQFPEKGLGHVEVIQYFHRYTVAWPSIHAGTQRRYRWLDPGGAVADIPRPGELPDLPAAWLDSLKRKPAAQLTAQGDAYKALQTLPTGPMSPNVQSELAKGLTGLTGAVSSRHDTALKSIGALLRLAERGGETGVKEALGHLERAFILAITKDRSRSPDDARLEWDRMLTGQRIHDLIASAPSIPTLADLLGKKPVTPPPPTPRILHPTQVVIHSTQPLNHPATPPNPHSDTASSEHTPQPVDEFDLLLMGDNDQGESEWHTSWGPVDLHAILDGDLEPEQPTILERDDGKHVFYKGRVNSLIGEPESAKSWIAQYACAQEIRKGNNVVIVDFEDLPKGVAVRMLSLGLDKTTLLQHFAFAGPDTAMGPLEQEEIFRLLDLMNPTVILVDGVNAAMTVLGLDLEKNRDATQFHQLILKPLTSTGAAVIVIDHVTKNKDNRGNYAIGAQAKKAAIDGAMIAVHVVEQFGKGRLGKSELTVLKDKQGSVREIAEKRGKNADYLGYVIIDGREKNQVQMRFVHDRNLDNTSDDTGMHPTEKALGIKMMQICQKMREYDPNNKGMTTNQIVDVVPGRRVDVIAAVDTLVRLHHLDIAEGARRAKVHILRSAYRGAGGDSLDTLLNAT